MVGKFITFLNREILGFLTMEDKVNYHFSRYVQFHDFN